MEKTFTINVPDELWVNAWDNNNTETYSYSGPETIWVLVGRNDTLLTWSDTELTADENQGEIVEVIDANEKTAIAYYLVHLAQEWEYTYTSQTNHDDSIWEAIDNPRLHDYFDLDHVTGNGLELTPVYKKATTIAEETATERLSYVKKYNDAYEFDTDIQTTIDTFISSTETYLNTMTTVYPWKYITISHDDIPKIPASLITVFKELPEIN